MGIGELFLFAVVLSMDAFAVAICKGLATKRVTWRHMIITGLWFGGFQALMPLIGYLFGSTFQQYITAYDHWIAFALLSFIGGKMIWESLSGDDEDSNDSFALRTMFLLAVSTSIDAMAAGVTFALLPDVNIVAAVSFIGIVTFLFSAVGVKIGNVFGAKYKHYAELAGGVVLVLLGVKILLEHLGVIG